MSEYLSPPAVAELLSIDVGKVYAWLSSGELRGVNVAERRGGRPRWRIARSDLESFLLRRSAGPPVQTTRRRKKRNPEVIKFF